MLLVIGRHRRHSISDIRSTAASELLSHPPVIRLMTSFVIMDIQRGITLALIIHLYLV